MISEKIPSRPSHALLITGSRTWDTEERMRSAFNDAWRVWGPSNVNRPVLLSGRCPDGADAMAEKLWETAGFEVLGFPADWGSHGKAAGFRRNQAMVDALLELRDGGVRVRCAAFIQLCMKTGCPQEGQEQLLSYGPPGHYSHGTIDARARALAAGLDVDDVIHPSLPPF